MDSNRRRLPPAGFETGPSQNSTGLARKQPRGRQAHTPAGAEEGAHERECTGEGGGCKPAHGGKRRGAGHCEASQIFLRCTTIFSSQNSARSVTRNLAVPDRVRSNRRARSDSGEEHAPFGRNHTSTTAGCCHAPFYAYNPRYALDFWRSRFLGGRSSVVFGCLLQYCLPYVEYGRYF